MRYFLSISGMLLAIKKCRGHQACCCCSSPYTTDAHLQQCAPCTEIPLTDFPLPQHSTRNSPFILSHGFVICFSLCYKYDTQFMNSIGNIFTNKNPTYFHKYCIQFFMARPLLAHMCSQIVYKFLWPDPFWLINVHKYYMQILMARPLLAHKLYPC